MKNIFKVLSAVILAVFLAAEFCPKAFALGAWLKREPKETEPYYKGLEDVVPTEEELREQEKKKLIEQAPKSQVIEQLEKKRRIGDFDVTPSGQR